VLLAAAAADRAEERQAEEGKGDLMSLRSGARILALVLLTMVTVVLPAATSARAAPGGWAQADVNAAVAKGVAFIESQQNADGSFGLSDPPAETAFAIISYGVLDRGDFNNLTPAMQTHLRNAVTYLLSQQAADGSFGCSYCTYTTGLALDALSASSGVDPGIPAAISSGRTYLISIQNAPPAVTGNPSSPDCSTNDHSGTDGYCGGWNYDAGFGRSDESNTGFALTGLFLTGGVPAATASINVGWQRHVQELQATNYFAARNDGGGDYEPGISSGGFSSNANNTGSLLFGLGYDGVAGSDPMVQAALIFSTDVLDEYELMKDTIRSAVYHSGMNEDGTCTIGDPTCDWAVTGDGGYHYSLWSLTKGFGQYMPPELSNPSNWHAKVVDLLLTQQNPDGSWPVDGRDDFTSIVATSFAVDALGLVGVPTHTLTVTKSGTGSGTVTSSPSGIDCGATCSASFAQGTIVTLTATAAAGSTFTGWSGDCTGTGTCTVTMDQARAVTATFALAAGTTSCALTATGTDGTGKKFIRITVRDQGSGLQAIDVLQSTNADTVVPPFTVGTTDPVVVQATKQNQALNSTVELSVTNVAGNVTICDPTITLVSRGNDRPVEQVLTGLPGIEHNIKIVNGDPGLKRLKITVNGHVFRAFQLKPGEERNLDVKSAMRPGNNNTIKLLGRGKRGSSALVVISD
jgi:List-Bact-rpt repeat protein/prenyltransferase/squalene oxidase-like repeat protein